MWPSRVARACILPALLTLAACATPLETVQLPGVGPAWTLGQTHDRGEGKGAITQLIPVGQQLHFWTHRITIEFLENSELSLSESVVQARSELLAACPGATFTTLLQDEYGISYEWRTAGCQASADQHALVRLLRGNDGLHRVTYAQKLARMDPETRALWLSRINNSIVIKGDALERVVLN